MINYKILAAELSPKVKPYVLEAVASVESNGSGFLSSGEPKILFEPHVFWRCLTKLGIDPNKHTEGNKDILYKVWKLGSYGKYSEQHDRLQRAVEINREAALMACSWGAFQVLGENYKSLGYATIQELVNDAYTEHGQVRMFVRFLKSNHLVDELERQDFKTFALQYNGKSAAKNGYASKMRAAADKFKNKVY